MKTLLSIIPMRSTVISEEGQRVPSQTQGRIANEIAPDVTGRFAHKTAARCGSWCRHHAYRRLRLGGMAAPEQGHEGAKRGRKQCRCESLGANLRREVQKGTRCQGDPRQVSGGRLLETGHLRDGRGLGNVPRHRSQPRRGGSLRQDVERTQVAARQRVTTRNNHKRNPSTPAPVDRGGRAFLWTGIHLSTFKRFAKRLNVGIHAYSPRSCKPTLYDGLCTMRAAFCSHRNLAQALHALLGRRV